MTTPVIDPNEFLLAGGVPSAKFEKPGTVVSGTITRTPEVQQQRDMDTGKPKFWDDGQPQMQIVIHLQTRDRDPELDNDDGVRALYVRGNMLAAVRAAVRQSGAQLATGGVLTVTYTGDGERKKAGFNPPKLYSATYAGGSQAAVNDLMDDGLANQLKASLAGARKLPPGITEEALAAMTPQQREALSVLYPDFPPF